MLELTISVCYFAITRLYIPVYSIARQLSEQRRNEDAITNSLSRLRIFDRWKTTAGDAPSINPRDNSVACARADCESLPRLLVLQELSY